MKLTKRLWAILLSLSMILTSMESSLTAVYADDTGTNISSQVVTGLDVSGSDDATVSSGSNLTVNMTFNASSIEVKAGDYIKVDWTLPYGSDNASLAGYSKTIALYQPGTDVQIGTADITSNGATITFNSNAEKYHDITGKLSFDMQATNSYSGSDANTSTATITAGAKKVTVHVTKAASGEVNPADWPFSTKSGAISSDDTTQVQWTIMLNTRSSELDGPLEATDTIVGAGTDQSYAPGNLVVQVYSGSSFQNIVFSMESFEQAYPGSIMKLEDNDSKLYIYIPKDEASGREFEISYTTNIDNNDAEKFENKLATTYTLKNSEPYTQSISSSVVNVNASASAQGEQNLSLNIEKLLKGTTTGIAGVTFEVTGPDGYSQSVTTGSDGTATLTKLAAGTYTITEMSAPDWIDYDTSSPATQTITLSEGAASTTFTATMENEQKTTSIPVTKKWVGVQGESAVINLLADGTQIDSVTLNDSNNWTYTFENLPVYKQGTSDKITYTVEEQSIAGYVSNVIETSDGYVITNTITGSVNIPVTKKWNGTPAQSATVTLYANDKEVKQVTLSADTNWSTTFQNLPEYDEGKAIVYTVKETPIDGYTSSVAGSAKEGFVITNTITGTVDIPVTKKWVGTAAQSVTVDLYANGQKVAYAILHECDNWTYTFKDEPEYDSQGNPIDYTVKEEALSGYESSVSGNAKDGYVITNTITGTTSVSVSKKWVGTPAKSAQVTLYANGSEVQSATLTAASGWSYTFANLPEYDNGTLIDYTIKEEALEGYDSIITGSAKDGYVITNTITGTVNIPVTKKWIGTPADSVTINLLANGKQTDSVVLSADNDWTYTFKNLPEYDNGTAIDYTVEEEELDGYSSSVIKTDDGYVITNTITGTVSVPVSKVWQGTAQSEAVVTLYGNGKEVSQAILNEANNWSYTFENLPEYDNGTAISYSVDEKAIAGYNTIITGNAKDGYVITNTITGTINIPVTKKWIGTPAASATVNLYANGSKVQSATLSASTGWSWTFKNLPKYNTKGQAIDYTLEEEPISGYTSTVTGNASQGFTITNTITGKVSVGVTKKWVGTPADSAVVTLYANGSKVQSATLTAASKWSYTFDNLPEYDNGQAIDYTVKEEALDGYDSVITGSAAEGYVITNIITGTVSVPVTKKWIGTAAKSVTVDLLANGKQTDSVVLSADNDWTYTFENLPEYSNGQAIDYTVKEEALDGYDSVITGSAAEGYVITNTITGTVSVPVTKKWIGTPAESVTIDLLANGKQSDSIVLSADNDWTYTFENLPEYDNGQAIDYTVKEESLSGYETSIAGSASEGYVITNTITGITHVTVTKDWVGTPAKSAEVTLYANGKEVKTVTLSAKSNWAYTFANLPEYEDGQAIDYTVKETPIEGYTSVISGSALAGYVITNTITGTISVPVTKKWVGEAADSVTVDLYADGVKTDSVVLSSANDWSHVFKDLPEYKEGTAIDYTIKEEALDGYDSVITGSASEGYVITNTITGTVSVPVTKKWVGTPAESVTIDLLANGKQTDSIVLSANNDWTYTFENLPEYEDGQAIDYTVKEESLSGYETSITGNASDGYVITNTITGTVNIPVTKKWIGLAQKSVTVDLYANGKLIQSASLPSESGWTYVFANLPEYENGQAIDYTVKEEALDGYDTVITGNAKEGYVITNTITGTVDIPVTKKWIGTPAESVTIDLMANGQKKDSVVLSAANGWTYTFKDLPEYENGTAIDYSVSEEALEGYTSSVIKTDEGYVITNTITGTVSVPVSKVWQGTAQSEAVVTLYANGKEAGQVTLNDDNNWSYTFTNLPEYDQGEAIDYTVKEKEITGYTTAISGSASEGYVITNTISGTIDIPVTKQWVGEPLKQAVVYLYQNGTQIDSAILSADTNWTYTFKNLPEYTSKGEAIDYTIKEEPVSGYTTGISGSAKEGFTITNTISGKVSVPVTKNWVGTPADSAEVTLYANGKAVASATLSASSKWTYTFANLDEYDNGQAIDYTVKEEALDGYDSVISGSASEGYVITNTITETTSVSVTKKWVGTPADSVIVDLLANGKQAVSVTLSADNDWTYTFKDLPEYDNGQAIDYTVKEEALDGYDSVISGSASEGYVITNTITGTTSVSVTKKWVGTPADSVTVNLYANGIKKDSIVLSADSSWTYTFENLPEYDNGQAIDYTVKEEPVEGYVSALSGNAKDGFTLINTITGTVSIPVTKEWIGTPASSATIWLYANGTRIQSAVLTASNKWSFVFANLPKYKNGQAIDYTVQEADLEGYQSSISGNASEGYVITNTITGTTSVSVTKKWIGTPADSVTVDLYANGVQSASAILDAQNGWSYTFKDLEKYEEGKVIAYTIKEESVSGYDSTITGNAEDGFTITNMITGTTDVSVTKKWVGQAAESATIDLYANGKKTDSVTLSEQSGWSYTFKDLPKYDQGSIITYTVKEEPVSGYETTITGSAEEGYVITNTITGTLSIPVVKEWQGYPAAAAEVDLYANGVKVDSAVLKAESGWKYTFANLPEYENGQAIDYTVEEVPIPGYVSETTGNAKEGFTIINTLTGSIGIPLSKRWIGTPTQSVTINRYANGVKEESVVLSDDNNWSYMFDNLPMYDENGQAIEYTFDEDPVEGYVTRILKNEDGSYLFNNVVSGSTSVKVTKKWEGTAQESVTAVLVADGDPIESATLDASNDWTHEFTDLPADKNGEPIVYTIKEGPVSGYKVSITGNQTDGYVITNTITGVTSVSVKKDWIGTPADSAVITLYADGTEYKTQTLTQATGWQYTFENLPEYNADGSLIHYTVEEEPVSGYATSISGSAQDGYVITNTITGTIDIPVTKNWVGTPADSVNVTLYANGKEYQTAALTAAKNWSYTFANLPEYEDGKKIEYTIKETGITSTDSSQYETTVSGDMETGFTITNTITGTVDVPVTKKWIGTPAESVTVDLYANGTLKDTVVLNDANSWSYTFKDLPEYDQGQTIDYTVKEEAVEGYVSAISGNAKDGYVITNTITGTVSVPVTKKWIGTPAESVTVDLYANGTLKDTVVLNDANSWSYTFKDLPEYSDTTGKAIVYTVKEEELQGYEASITGSAKDGYVITNTITGTVNIPVTKKWIGTAAKSVTVNLMKDGTKVDSAVITPDDNWTYTFKDLPEYDQGKAIEYTVQEEAISGYTQQSISGNAKDGFVIVNRKNTSKSSGTTTKSSRTAKASSANTASQSNVWLYSLLAMAALIVISLIWVLYRKNSGSSTM